MAGEGPVQQQLPNQGSVPLQVNAPTVNVADTLDKVLQNNTAELSKYALAAATPVAGGHAGQMPASFQTPLREYQKTPLNNNPVVGAGNARARGIGNTITAVLNTVGQVKTALDNKKKVEIASSTQQLLQAQQAANQAQQILATDPNNAAAKEQLQHNNEIMGTILTGKHGKDIMKGFNIDYTDPQSNNTLQHQGVADGKKRAEAAVQAFNKGTPEVSVPNTQAQAIYAAKAAEAKSTIDTMKALVPLISAQMRHQTAEDQIQGRMNQEQLRQLHEDARAYQKSQDAWGIAAEKIKADFARDKNKFGYKLAEIAARGQEELAVFNAKVTSKNSDPTALNKAYEEHQRKGTAEISNMTANIAAMEAQKAAMVTGKAEKSQIDSVTTQIQQAKDALAQYKTAFDGANTYYQKRLMLEGSAPSGTGESRPSSTSGLGSASSYLTESDSLPEDDDEDN